MATVIGVRFRNAGKLYYFNPGDLWPTAGDAVIVETVRGMEYGEVVTGVKEVSDELIEKGYRLKIYDAYRPQKAVTHFMDSGKDRRDKVILVIMRSDTNVL